MTSLADAMQFNAGHDVNWSIVRNQYICSPSFQNLFGAKDEVDGLSAAVGVVEGGAVRQVPEVVTAVRTVGWTDGRMDGKGRELKQERVRIDRIKGTYPCSHTETVSPGLGKLTASPVSSCIQIWSVSSHSITGGHSVDLPACSILRLNSLSRFLMRSLSAINLAFETANMSLKNRYTVQQLYNVRTVSGCNGYTER